MRRLYQWCWGKVYWQGYRDGMAAQRRARERYERLQRYMD